jgi:hypothetical protein
VYSTSTGSNAPSSKSFTTCWNIVLSDDELIIAYLQAFKRKHVALASQMALLQSNILAQAPHAANVEQSNYSTYFEQCIKVPL